MIDRKTAETARRYARRIDGIANPDGVDIAIRAECGKVWNEFCAEETRRLEAKKTATKYAQILPGIYFPAR